ncbi:MAG: hypothetical protein V1907_01880 [Candidatus Kerfeldbacteria bacterium]
MNCTSAESCTCSSRRPGKCPYCLDGIVLDRGLDALWTLPKVVDSIGRPLCVCCRKVIPAARIAAVKYARTCIRCQGRFDQVNQDRLRILELRAKRFGLIPRGPSDGTEARSTRRRLPRAELQPAY